MLQINRFPLTVALVEYTESTCQCFISILYKVQ